MAQNCLYLSRKKCGTNCPRLFEDDIWKPHSPPLWDTDARARPVPSGTKQQCEAKVKENPPKQARSGEKNGRTGIPCLDNTVLAQNKQGFRHRFQAECPVLTVCSPKWSTVLSRTSSCPHGPPPIPHHNGLSSVKSYMLDHRNQRGSRVLRHGRACTKKVGSLHF